MKRKLSEISRIFFLAKMRKYFREILFSFRIILVLSVVDFILCFKKKDLNGQESILKQIYKLSDVF